MTFWDYALVGLVGVFIGYWLGWWLKPQVKQVMERPPPELPSQMYMRRALDADAWSMELIRCGRSEAARQAADQARNYREIADSYIRRGDPPGLRVVR